MRYQLSRNEAASDYEQQDFIQIFLFLKDC
jgi:hypothetical protein